MSESTIKPLGKRVLLSPIEVEEKTKGGLYIPVSTEEKKPACAKVVALGETKKDHKFSVKVGDTVYFKKYSPEEIELDGQKYLVIEETDILAVLSK